MPFNIQHQLPYSPTHYCTTVLLHYYITLQYLDSSIVPSSRSGSMTASLVYQKKSFHSLLVITLPRAPTGWSSSKGAVRVWIHNRLHRFPRLYSRNLLNITDNTTFSFIIHLQTMKEYIASTVVMKFRTCNWIWGSERSFHLPLITSEPLG